MTMNRDNNASKNILDILIYHMNHKCRHPSFSRSRILPSLFQKVLDEIPFESSLELEHCYIDESHLV